MTAEEAIEYLKDPIGKREQHDEAIRMAVEALRNSAELISWLDECIGDEHTTPIERATLVAVKCKVEGIVYAGNIRPDK